MKKIILTALTLLLLISTTLPALALGPLDVDAELPFYSKYIWRGMEANADPVVQPSFFAGILGIGIGFWGNMDLTDINGKKGEFSEIDYVASYGLPLPLVDLNFGLIYYNFPNSDAPSTAEAFVKGSVGILLNPSLEIYYDFKEIDGSYINAGISYPVALTDDLDLELGANLGFGDGSYTKGYFGIDASGATNFLLSASVPFKPIPFFTVTPSASYSTLLGDAKDGTDLANQADGFDMATNAVIFGLSASFSF